MYQQRKHRSCGLPILGRARRASCLEKSRSYLFLEKKS